MCCSGDRLKTQIKEPSHWYPNKLYSILQHHFHWIFCRCTCESMKSLHKVTRFCSWWIITLHRHWHSICMYVRPLVYIVCTYDKKLHKAHKFVLGFLEHLFMHCHIKSWLKVTSFVIRPLAYSTTMKSQWSLSRY